MASRRALGLISVVLAVLPLAGRAASWTISPDQRTVGVTTKTLRAAFRDGALVSVANLTGGDSLFAPKPASACSASLRDRKGAASVDRTTRVSAVRRGAGVRVTLRGLSGDAGALLTLDLGSEPDGSLTVQMTGKRDAAGLLSAQWGVAGIDAARTRIVAPFLGGQAIEGLRGPGSMLWNWPSNWQAAQVTLQGARGGLSIWTDDPDAIYKSLALRRVARELTLSFGSESRLPLAEARSVTSPVWRIQAHKGDWKVPALAYRARMARSRQPIARRDPAWVRQIRLLVRVSEPNSVALQALRDLASRVDARQTLIYVPTWRKLPYDVLYPDYTPREGFVEWSRAAQGLGYRVMVHGNMVGIGPRSPDLPRVERYIQTDRASGAQAGWYLDRPGDPCQIYCLNPAAAPVRELLIERFRKAWQEVGFDALHLDFPTLVSTVEGDIDGMSSSRGVEVYLNELRAALPGVALGTEGLNETLLACSFAQIGEPYWFSKAPGVQMHPVRGLLFAPYCGLYGHLGMPSQESSLPAFLNHHDFFDRMGAWPTLSIDGPLNPRAEGTDLVISEARYFQRHGLVPAPEEVRFPAELYAWRGDNGISALFDTPPGRRLAPRSAPGKPAWSLFGKVNSYEGTGSVLDWRAFDGKRLFGLDPERRYAISPDPPNAGLLHLTSASSPIIVQEVRDNPARALFVLSGQSAVVADLVETATSAAVGILVGGRQEPIGSGASFKVAQTACGGEALPGIMAHPPYEGNTAGGLTYGEYVVSVPASGRTLLRFAMGLGDLTDARQAAEDKVTPLSDGATFIVSADGRRLFSEHVLRGLWVWREVDLTAFKGRSIVLRLSTSPGPKRVVSFDWAAWGQPRIINRGEASARPLRLSVYSPGGTAEACFGDPDRPGRIVGSRPAPGGGSMLEVELPRPQPFGLLFRTLPAEPGVELAALPPIVGSASGGIMREASVFGSGEVTLEEVDGKPARVINGHTPDEGRTVLDWPLRLPAQPLRLTFRARVRQGGNAVAFQVQVNGQPVWNLPMPYPIGWQEGSVDLRAWSGKPILLSLVTDSVGANLCDWAQWADVRLEAR